MDALTAGRHVLRQEAEALRRAAEELDVRFERVVEAVLACPGRVVTAGVGKSGHMARKAAGTFASTGTPSLFLHAAEAVHGDLGMVAPGDVVLLYSQSGETDEVVRLFPSLREQGALTVLVTGRPDSSGGRAADLVLPTGVTDEACPHNLAPTTSTVVMTALSDALAVAVMERRGFGPGDFARFHPSGTLGKRLLLRVRDVMRPLRDVAIVAPDTEALALVQTMTEHAVGAAIVLREGRYAGLVSEGDLRRHLLRHPGRLEGTVEEMVNPDAATLPPDLLAYEAFEAFQNHPRKIGEMPVVEGDELRGLLVLKDLLRTGIV